MRTGRPLKFESVASLQEQIDEYFRVTPIKEHMITGLAVHLDTDRSTLMEYEGRPDFSNAIKKAKTRIEMSYEKRLIDKGRAGDIFALKNFDWKDKTEVEQKIKLEEVASTPETDALSKEYEDKLKEQIVGGIAKEGV